MYRCPRSQVRRFKGYLRDSGREVSLFLVVMPEVESDAEGRADPLKAQSEHDTDVAIVAAEDLKWESGAWPGYASRFDFRPEVFNTTGVLSRGELEQRVVQARPTRDHAAVVSHVRIRSSARQSTSRYSCIASISSDLSGVSRS